MRYSKQISTGLLIESQSGGDIADPSHLDAMRSNAISQGIPQADIEVGYEDDEVVRGWIEQQDELAKTYSDHRASSYPSIPDQLDMLWHAMDTGILPKVDSFYSINKSVKDKYPKE